MAARLRARRAATAVEFALLLPIFVLIVGGLMDIAWVAYQRSALSSSVAMGCRAAALVDPGEGDLYLASVVSRGIESMEAAMSAAGADCGAGGCTSSVETVGAMPARSLRCTLGRTVRPISGIVLDPLPVQATILVRMEWQR